MVSLQKCYFQTGFAIFYCDMQVYYYFLLSPVQFYKLFSDGFQNSVIFMLCSFDAQKETACMKAEFGYVKCKLPDPSVKNQDAHYGHHYGQEESMPVSLCLEFFPTKPMKCYIQKRDGLRFHQLNCIKSIMVMLTVPFCIVCNLNKECY